MRDQRRKVYDLSAIYLRAVYNLGHDYVWLQTWSYILQQYTIVKRGEIIRISSRISLAGKRARAYKNSCSMLRFHIFNSVKSEGTHLSHLQLHIGAHRCIIEQLNVTSFAFYAVVQLVMERLYGNGRKLIHLIIARRLCIGSQILEGAYIYDWMLSFYNINYQQLSVISIIILVNPCFTGLGLPSRSLVGQGNRMIVWRSRPYTRLGSSVISGDFAEEQQEGRSIMLS